MKIIKSILQFSAVTAMTMFSCICLAQDKPADTPSSLTDEIEVVRPYKPVLADAVKIRRNPDLNEHEVFKPQLTYTILDKRQERNTDIKQLQAQLPVDITAAPLKNNYVKIGAGNMNGGLGELYLNTGSDEALQAGLFLKHLNQEGTLNKQKFSSQQAAVFGRSILDETTLNGELGYNRLSTFFYGFNPASPASNPDPAKQRFDVLSLKGEILKNYKENSSSNYGLNGDAYFLKNILSTKENSFALSGFADSRAWGPFNLGLNVSGDFTTVKDAATNISNNIARVNPYMRFGGSAYNLTIGLNLAQEFGTVSRTNVLPAVTGEATIIPKYATIFAGYTGDVMKTSVRDLAEENPYLNANLSVKNAVEKMHIFGGIRGNAGSGFGYKATAFYKSVTNMPFLVNSVTGVQKFDLIYDGGDTKVAGLEAELNLNTPEVFSWTGKLTINNYTLATQAKAWSKPDFQLSSNARVSVNKKFIVNGEVLVNSETYAKSYAFTPAPVESVVKVKSFVDLSGGAEYRFKDKIGLYVKVNNILGTGYQQYLYYSRLGLNVLAGFNYSF